MAFLKKLIEFITELQSKVTTLQSNLANVQSENEALKTRNAELERQLKTNSTNSHKPPSTDFGKNKNKNTSVLFPRIGDKKQGGQPGHRGKTLEITATPDDQIYLRPSVCTCGMSLKDVAGTIEESRQVFDVPTPKLVVTQFNKVACICPGCGACNTGAFPADVPAHVQYGSGLRALAVLLNNAYHLPLRKVRQLMLDLFGYDVNQSTVASANEICYDNLKTAETSIKQAVTEGETGHFDETGIEAANKRQWLHTACTALLTYLFFSEHRGAKAIGSEEGVISDFKGWAVHDCYPTYFTYDHCKHALCCAHLLRELQAQVEEGRKWAALMRDFLLELHQKSDFGKGVVADFLPYSLRYDQICNLADAEEPKPPPKPEKSRGKAKQTKGRNLLGRLVKYKSAVVAFAQYKEVPFTNNQAERDIRPTKTKQKVSNCFRTVEGAKIYARIQGFISTVRKQEQDVFEMLKKSFSPDFVYQFNSG
jgi:transposase